ncbi:MAG: trypsin-like peptidase domain-containing protein, partial [Dongiaceae bacterium]
MSRQLAIKIFAPLAVSASLLTAALMMSGAPGGAARAELGPASAVVQSVPPPVQDGLPSLAPMLKAVMPAVVNIAVTAKVPINNPLLQDPFFRRFFGVPDDVPQEQEAQAIGSGVIVDANKGYVLTNNHVVEQADSIRVRLSDDREFDAKLIGRDPDTDIAVLQVKADKL